MADLTSGAPDPYIGRTLDNRYHVKRLLGRGGMGVVYEADHVGLDRRVAIKFMLGGRSDADALARFQREARAASKVIDSHVVQIFDVGAHDGVDFLVMEYLEGRDLRRVLKEEGRLTPERVIAIGAQILRGLHAIHAGGIVHRDIKPANILLVDAGRGRDVVKIMDFGISKSTRDGSPAITKSGHVVGTPQYMSPEQLAGQAIDPRSDLYAAALVLYELAAGAPPFTGPSTAELTTQHLADRPPRLEDVVPGLPRSLVMAVERGLEKSPDARFRDALEFAAALDSDGTPLMPRVDALTHPAGRTSERETVPALPSANAREVAAREAAREAATRPLSPSRDADATTPTAPAVRPARRLWLTAAAVLAVSGPLVVFAVMRGRESPQPTPAPSVPVVTAPVVPVDAALAVPTDATPAQAPSERSAAHLVRAQEAEADGRLVIAIAQYQAAYDVAPTPALLVQIGGLHERLGQPTEARAIYERVVTTTPTSREAAHARSRLAALARPSRTGVASPSGRTASSRGPATGGCRCIVDGGTEALCPRSGPRQCRCEAGLRPLCPTPPTGVCQTPYVPMTIAAVGSCTGYSLSGGVEQRGTMACVVCTEVATYVGRHGERCKGVFKRSGAPGTGRLVCE